MISHAMIEFLNDVDIMNHSSISERLDYIKNSQITLHDILDVAIEKETYTQELKLLLLAFYFDNLSFIRNIDAYVNKKPSSRTIILDILMRAGDTRHKDIIYNICNLDNPDECLDYMSFITCNMKDRDEAIFILTSFLEDHRLDSEGSLLSDWAKMYIDQIKYR